MRLKKKTILLLFLFLTTSPNARICKPQIPRSFNYAGRLTPNHTCSLCPKIEHNCCTNHDQMNLHKNWKTQTKGQIKLLYKDNLSAFAKFNEVLSIKDELDLPSYVSDFEEVKKPNGNILNHLEDISKEFRDIDTAGYKVILNKLLVKIIPRMQKKMVNLRKGVLCLMCDWNFHKDVNVESMTILYNNKFCVKLVDDFIDVVYEKNKFFRLMMIVDEFYYLTTKKRLVTSASDRATYRRYNLIITQCIMFRGDLNKCGDFCREFNVNRFTYMFDGEEESIKDFVKNYIVFYQNVTKNPKKFFKKRRTGKLSSENVFSKEIISDPILDKIKENTFDLNFKTYPQVNFFEKKHKINGVQIERLDDEISSMTLFKLNDDPVDISNYMIIFDPYKGIDLYKTSLVTNLKVSVDHLLALIHSGGTNANHVNEHIEDSVAEVVRPIKIKSLGNWMNDFRMVFKRFVKSNDFEDKAVKWYKRSYYQRWKDKMTRTTFYGRRTKKRLILQ